MPEGQARVGAHSVTPFCFGRSSDQETVKTSPRRRWLPSDLSRIDCKARARSRVGRARRRRTWESACGFLGHRPLGGGPLAQALPTQCSF